MFPENPQTMFPEIQNYHLGYPDADGYDDVILNSWAIKRSLASKDIFVNNLCIANPITPVGLEDPNHGLEVSIAIKRLIGREDSHTIQSHSSHVIVYNDSVWIEYINRNERNKYFINIYGDVGLVQSISALALEAYGIPTTEGTISLIWVYMSKNSGLQECQKNVPVRNYPTDDLYSFLHERADGLTLKKLYRDFYRSFSNILILKGPPGTGKTSFLRGLLSELNTAAYLTYDESVAESDEIFEKFLSSSNANVIIFEDADAFLQSRKEGNKVMHRFLNMGDGLLSMPNKKIVFTTNLEDLGQIDEALTRPGRCYDIIEFKALEKEHAQAVAAKHGRELPEDGGPRYTLAEIFNSQDMRKEEKKRPIGFV